MKFDLTINGAAHSFEVHPGMLLMELLRKEGVFSVKHGCETGECGTCTVLIDGRSINSCIYLAAQAHGKSIVTVEGLGTPEKMHPIQAAFVETGAVQCGYCTPAMVLASHELLSQTLEPTEADVRDALSGQLCRCTGYVKPVEAVMLAARRMKEGGHREEGLSSHREADDSPGRRQASLR